MLLLLGVVAGGFIGGAVDLFWVGWKVDVVGLKEGAGTDRMLGFCSKPAEVVSFKGLAAVVFDVGRLPCFGQAPKLYNC